MILRSGNVVIKRPKHSCDEIKEDDIISKLPDAILIHIISLLPATDANRTCILSKRWKDLRAFLPDLQFVMPFCYSIKEVNKFYDYVDQTLALRDAMPIQRFSLQCFKNCNYNRGYDWLREVVKCKVQELELRFAHDRYKVRFCWDLFRTCNTLVVLTLKGPFVLEVPKDKLLFPCLKKIKLVSIVYSGDQSFANLLSGCPSLEDLFVKRAVSRDNLETIKVTSPSLKRLEICSTKPLIPDYRVQINAPKLEYLYIMDYMSRNYSLTRSSSLLEVYLNTTGLNYKLVTFLLSIKTLTLDLRTLHVSNMPMFPNLLKLVIGIEFIWQSDDFFVFFDKTPNLEHITFLDRRSLDSAGWNLPAEAPYSLCFKTKDIVILNEKTVTQELFPFVKFLLEHSTKLETFTIKAHNIDPEMRDQLLSFHHGSDLCRIRFV